MTDYERLGIVGSEHCVLRSFSASLPMALHRARESSMRLFRPMLATHDLTEQQWRVLRALAASHEPIEVGTVAERTFLLGPSLSRILTNLERRGFIERRTPAHDQRRGMISLSTSGHRLFERIAPESEAIYRRIEEAFGNEELTELLTSLDRMTRLELTAEDQHEEEAS